MGTFFPNARNFNIGNHANFSNVGRDQTNYINDNRKTIKDSYNSNVVNNHGSYNTTYSSELLVIYFFDYRELIS